MPQDLGGRLKTVLQPGQDYTTTYVPAPRAPVSGVGMISPGNLNVYDRPIVPNPTRAQPNRSSTILSRSFGFDKGETLLPTVSDGADGLPPHLMSDPEAIGYYRRTGQSLGTFDTPAHATAFGNSLHNQQASMTNFGGRTALPTQLVKNSLPAPDLTKSLGMAPMNMSQLIQSIFNKQ